MCQWFLLSMHLLDLQCDGSALQLLISFGCSSLKVIFPTVGVVRGICLIKQRWVAQALYFSSHPNNTKNPLQSRFEVIQFYIIWKEHWSAVSSTPLECTEKFPSRWIARYTSRESDNQHAFAAPLKELHKWLEHQSWKEWQCPSGSKKAEGADEVDGCLSYSWGDGCLIQVRGLMRRNLPETK